MVYAQLRGAPEYREARSILWFAGENYREELLPLVRADGKTSYVPMNGLQQGEQLAWLRARLDQGHSTQDIASTNGFGHKRAVVPTAPRLADSTAPKADDFRRALLELKSKARGRGAVTLEVRARDLHRIVGGYPGNRHRMPVCCSVMRQEMRAGDKIVAEPPKGAGASLEISYRL